MKKRFFLAASVLLLTACTAPDADIAPSNAPAETKTPETAVSTPTPAPAEEPTLPLYWIGECNSQGFYQREPIYDATTYAYGGGGIMAHYYDFANATEEIVGEALDLETANLHLYADEESLYWFWSGMITDTPLYSISSRIVCIISSICAGNGTTTRTCAGSTPIPRQIDSKRPVPAVS